MGGFVDLFERGVRFFRRIDERHTDQAKFLVELGEDRMREGFGSNPGTVGDDEYGGRHQWRQGTRASKSAQMRHRRVALAARWLAGNPAAAPFAAQFLSDCHISRVGTVE
jgi:hypothetical protein